MKAAEIPTIEHWAAQTTEGSDVGSGQGRAKEFIATVGSKNGCSTGKTAG